MALSGLDIYKLLPKTNCKECGFATCLAFAMQLAKKAVGPDKCPYLSQEAKQALELASQPAIRLISIGEGENRLQVGNETVMFRHEEKFQRPCGLGFILEDNLPQIELKARVEKISRLQFERVGQTLSVNLIAIRQTGTIQVFVQAVKLAIDNTNLALILMSTDEASLKPALDIAASRKPLVFGANEKNIPALAKLAASYKCPLVLSDPELSKLAVLSQEANKLGAQDLLLDTGCKPIADKLWDLTQLRRLALKKNNRPLGYPCLTLVEDNDGYEEIIEAATYICKYAGIILLKGIAPWQALSLLTLRQNIYSDPQKPLQIEPGLYPVTKASSESPLLVTTNFSLTYYTVLAEVEASKVPAYILAVDTQGMSVLTAWAAEKFTAEKISAVINNSETAARFSHRQVIIPGYVAVISGDLQEQSGWKVIVGPKEAAGLPSFLKNLR
jgi:acetyl-CoA decarbonylase/synthase complex subunit gamma